MYDFVKYEAQGNDYLVVDPSQASMPITSRTVRELCNRRQGIGADGVIFGPFIDRDTIRLQIFNSDGSECGRSGNGLRIFAHYLLDQGYLSSTEFSLRTVAGENRLKVIDFDAGIFTVELGPFTFDSEHVPATGPRREIIDEQLRVGEEVFRVSCVNNGNPHCVIFDSEASQERVSRIGPLVSNSPLLPEGANVQLVQVLDRKHLYAQIWERGSGYTLASGSSACAIACVAHRLGYVDAEVTVRMPGGDVSVLHSSDTLFLTANVCKVAEGTLAPSFKRQLLSNAGNIHVSI